MPRILLILDIDETLVHAVEKPLTRPCDFTVGRYFVYCRPLVDAFLTSCEALYDIAFWSSGGETYVRGVVERIVPAGLQPVLIWSRDRCTERIDPYTEEAYFLKNLKKIEKQDFDLARVLIVENEPRKVQRNYGNAIYVKSFLGDRDDQELALLGKYLQGPIHTTSDVRVIEKRDWRLQVSGGSEAGD